jgi:hypothetical protein
MPDGVSSTTMQRAGAIPIDAAACRKTSDAGLSLATE